MKGRNNYVCRKKVYDNERNAFLTGLEEVADFQIIREWEQTTETGDRAEIRALPENSSAWLKVDARRDTCTGTKCQQFERCFITQMMQRAAASDLIIVNHHLFFADLALKDEGYGQIIPEYDAVIFDEAHEIEDVVGQYFGVSVSNLQVDELRQDILTAARAQDFGSAELDRILMSAWEASERFFGLFGTGSEGRIPFGGHDEFLRQHAEEYMDLHSAVELIHVQLNLIHNAPEEVDSAGAASKGFC